MGIAFRPHHFLCALCFQGRGYTPAFIDNFSQIMTLLSSETPPNIHITSHTDSICTPCPHRRQTTCTSETNIKILDNAHAAALHWQPETDLTWAEAKDQMAAYLTLEVFHRICDSCSWKTLGICEEAITSFLSKNATEK